MYHKIERENLKFYKRLLHWVMLLVRLDNIEAASGGDWVTWLYLAIIGVLGGFCIIDSDKVEDKVFDKMGGIVDKLCVRLESTGQLECKLDSCVLVYASYFVDMLLLCPTLAR